MLFFQIFIYFLDNPLLYVTLIKKSFPLSLTKENFGMYILSNLTYLIYLNIWNEMHVWNFWLRFFDFSIFDYFNMIFLEMPMLSIETPLE